MAKVSRLVTAAIFGVTLVLTAGCRVDEHKNGNNEDVKIATPFGGMSVKTNDAVVGGTGLTPYPGAVLVKKDKGKDDGAADVNMSFGSFHLGVKAVSYTTPDSPDQVLAFYRKDMAHFGVVVQCRGDHAVGIPDHTPDGVSCSSDHGAKFEVDDDHTHAEIELKTGSLRHQHIVAINPQGTGTKISFIVLDLPGNLGKNGQDEDED